MKTYRCINCGQAKESQQSCNCPVCGYKMFEEPYERSDVLRREIVCFIEHLRLDKLQYRDFDIYRPDPKKKAQTGNGNNLYIYKKDDDQRFPDFLKIQNYVCAASKTEQFRERLIIAISQIRKHISTPYSQKYSVSFSQVIEKINALDVAAIEALNVLGIAVKLDPVEFQNVNLKYREEPNAEILSATEDVLDALEALAEKIIRFIKQNNVYGSVHRLKARRTFKPTENSFQDIKKCMDRLSEIQAKKYIVDIFDDGSKELNEMLSALWYAVEVVVSVPVLDKKSVYSMQNEVIAINDEIRDVFMERINRRYSEIDTIIHADGFLSGYSADALFTAYGQMIELDAWSILGINKENLLKIGESEQKLNELVGLTGIKEGIKKIKAFAIANKGDEGLNLHMCFYGNPGTGKTEVARIIAGILYENRILPTNKVVEVDRSGLVSQYVGETPQKTMEQIRRAMGGVLFIDEAYALVPKDGGFDYGNEAVATLIKAMEDYRGKFCVILAGYRTQMREMISSNPGFQSRIQFELDFPNYNRDELSQIINYMLGKRGYCASEAAVQKMLDIADVKRKSPNFANAREVRNILDQVIMCQNLRCAGTEDRELGIVDVNRYAKDAKINLSMVGSGNEERLMTGEEELNQLVGLDSVKRMIKKIKAYAKRNKGEKDFNLHMCFYGNPGTGKTEVAHILSKILYEADVLPEAKLIETSGLGLLGRYVGETAPKTVAKVDEAMNGVLFVDEAYSLAGTTTDAGGSTNYGDEAIAVLLKEMEDRRGQFCVIFAGYNDKMRDMLSTNPGLESRIQFALDFSDYSRDELGEIARMILTKKKYRIVEDALQLVLDVTEHFRKQPNFANARTVRNILDQVIMSQNLRTEDAEENDMILLCDVEDYLADEGINLSSNTEKRTLGFF